MKDDPAAVAVVMARKVRSKIKQNLFWAAIYNVLAILIAAGALYPSLGILLQPEWAALAMSASTVIVTLNAPALNREKLATSRDHNPKGPPLSLTYTPQGYIID